MDPITVSLILGAVAEGVAYGLAGAAILSIFMITLDMVIGWFQQRAKRLKKEKEEIQKRINSLIRSSNCEKHDLGLFGFTAMEKTNSGDYQVVQGIFNTMNNKIVDHRVIKSKELDRDLKNKHNGKALAIYT